MNKRSDKMLAATIMVNVFVNSCSCCKSYILIMIVAVVSIVLTAVALGKSSIDFETLMNFVRLIFSALIKS